MDFRGYNEQNGQPLVTTIVLCYNQACFILESLESVRSQTYKNIQLVITDDASSDDSVKFIREWIKDNNIICTFIAHEKNTGICKIVNEALVHAKGKYIAQIASDDIWKPEKTENQVAIMEGLDSSFGAVYSDASQIDEKGIICRKSYMHPGKEQPGLKGFYEGWIFSDLLTGNFIIAPTVLIRNDCYKKVGLYDENLIFEDWDMWLRISQQYKFAFSPFISVAYRKRKDSADSKLHTSLKGDFYCSVIMIYVKCRNSKILEDKDRRLLKTKLLLSGNILYSENYAGKKRYLYMVMSNALGLRSIFMYLCSLIGVSYSFYLKIKNGLKRLKKCASIIKTW